MEKYHMIGFKTKQEFAYTTIREAIVNGEFLPRERLIISTLAENMGISEIPIREALKRLEVEGFVTMNSNGMIVSSVTPEELIDLYEVRIELEGIAIRRSTSKIDEDGINDLKNILEQQTAAIKIDDIPKFTKLDKEFHLTIYTYCGVDLLIKAIIEAWTHTERGSAVFRIAPWRTEFSIKEHYDILDAVTKRDAGLAEKILKIHKQEAFNAYIEKLGINNV